MIEIGQAVYFIESRWMEPVIKFGIVRDLWEDRGFYHYAVDFLSIKIYSQLADSKPSGCLAYGGVVVDNVISNSPFFNIL